MAKVLVRKCPCGRVIRLYVSFLNEYMVFRPFRVRIEGGCVWLTGRKIHGPDKVTCCYSDEAHLSHLYDLKTVKCNTCWSDRRVSKFEEIVCP